MTIEVLLVQLLVLAFTGALWWIARRDLASRVPPPVPPADTAELEQLCTTLAALVTSLTRRLEALERPAAPVALPVVPAPPIAAAVEADPPPPALAFGPRGHLEPAAAVAEPAPDPRFEPVYALLESGVSDPIEIARQTGLGRGEVDLILSLRDRRAF